MRDTKHEGSARPTRSEYVNRESHMTSTDEERTSWRKARRERREAVVALRRRALAATSLAAVLDDALDVVTTMLGVDFSKIVKREDDGDAVTVVAARGWDRALTGCLIEHATERSAAGYTLHAGSAVVVEDIRRVPELRGDELLRDHHVVSGASVIVRGQRRPFGVIGVHSTKRRMIGLDELAFLQAVADVISAAAYRFDLDAALATRRSSGLQRAAPGGDDPGAA